MTGCDSVIGATFDHPAASDGGADGSEGPPPGESTGGGDSTADGAPDDGALPDGGCAWPSSPNCIAPTISNEGAFGKLPATGDDVALTAKTVFDTNTCASGVLGACAPVIQAVGPAACVCRANSLAVKNVAVGGDRALVLLVHGTVTIAGTLDVGATGFAKGAGAEPAIDGETGLFDGEDSLVPLRGGRSGASTGVAGVGAGGGAIQISAGEAIVVAPEGIIQAGGGGGGGQIYAGSGGGSGGAILLEAPVVKLEGVVAANGGGGGGGGNRSVPGEDGTDARDALRTAAPGGAGRDGAGCQLSGTTSGGSGGSGGAEGSPRKNGAPADSRSCLPPTYVEAGGAGGGIGRIRINTGGTLQRSPSAYVSPTASTGTFPL